MAFKVSNKVFEEIFENENKNLKVIKDPQQIVESFLKHLKNLVRYAIMLYLIYQFEKNQ